MNFLAFLEFAKTLCLPPLGFCETKQLFYEKQLKTRIIFTKNAKQSVFWPVFNVCGDNAFLIPSSIKEFGQKPCKQKKCVKGELAYMRIAFVDCASNFVDPFEAFSRFAEEKVPGVSIERLTAPDLLKVPLVAKKLLSSGSEAAVVFLIADEEDWAAVSLVHEKIIDVELASEKYVHFAIISEGEFSSDKQLEQIIEKRFKTVLDLCVNCAQSPYEVSKAIGNPDMASAFAELSGLSGAVTGNEEEGGPSASDAGPTYSDEERKKREEDDVHSLF